MAKLMIRSSEGKWMPMDENRFTQEAELQEMLLENPELIPIDDLGENVPPMLVVGREVNIPRVGYIDLLCVDESGLVTIVECKLDVNTEVKRKVVGQILSYAAHLKGCTYSRFEAMANAYFARQAPEAYRGLTLAEAIEKFRASDEAPADETSVTAQNEQFRRSVEDCLHHGKFRLLIIVDKVNDELRNIVRYLDEASGDAFAIHCCELGYFKNGEMEAIVPRMVGFGTKTLTTQAPVWTRGRFEEKTRALLGDTPTQTLLRLLDWSIDTYGEPVWGRGQVLGSFTPKLAVNGHLVSLFNSLTDGNVYLPFESWKTAGLDENTRKSIHDQFTQIVGITIKANQIDKYPGFSIRKLSSEEAINRFKDAILSVASQLQQLEEVAR